jgi:hypothetical protein
VWTVEVRPRVRDNWLGLEHGGGISNYPFADPGRGNELLLARADVPVTRELASSRWVVENEPAPIDVVEDDRPFLLHLRLLQELLIQDVQSTGSTSAAAPAIVASGLVNADGSASARASGGMVATHLGGDGAHNAIRVTFTGYEPPPDTGGPQYVVKVLPWTGPTIPQRERVNVVFAEFLTEGMVFRVARDGAQLTAAELADLRLMIEVTRYE